MSMENFLSFLQQLLTMVEPKNKSSVALAKTALKAVSELIQASGKGDPLVLRAIFITERNFDYFVEHKQDFAGIPGAHHTNYMKRKRLEHMINPGC